MLVVVSTLVVGTTDDSVRLDMYAMHGVTLLVLLYCTQCTGTCIPPHVAAMHSVLH